MRVKELNKLNLAPTAKQPWNKHNLEKEKAKLQTALRKSARASCCKCCKKTLWSARDIVDLAYGDWFAHDPNIGRVLRVDFESSTTANAFTDSVSQALQQNTYQEVAIGLATKNELNP